MSGNLYQLYSKTMKVPGQYFPVDGPYDKHGYVVKSDLIDRPGKYEDGAYLNLIRGTGNVDRRDHPRTTHH